MDPPEGGGQGSYLTTGRRSGCCGLLSHLKLWNYKRMGEGVDTKEGSLNSVAMHRVTPTAGKNYFCVESMTGKSLLSCIQC